jgi:hypothetical protein
MAWMIASPVRMLPVFAEKDSTVAWMDAKAV